MKAGEEQLRTQSTKDLGSWLLSPGMRKRVYTVVTMLRGWIGHLSPMDECPGVLHTVGTVQWVRL